MFENDTQKTGGGSSSRGIAHKVATAAGIVLCVLLVPVLLVNCFLLYQSATNQEEVPSVGGVVPFIVLSDSMNPEIASGDLIVCHKADAESVKVGDIISFFDPEGNGVSVVSHRVVSVDADDAGQIAFTTKGDANNVEDASPVPANKLIGVYSFRIPGLGNVAMFMQSPQGLVVCVLVPVVLLLAYDVVRRRACERASQAQTEALEAELAELRAQKSAQEDTEVSSSDN